MLKQTNSPDKPASLRLYWQGRDSSENQAPYNPEAPPTPSKRPSIENLKRASRVRNSHIFRHRNPEYDPSQVYVPQRPLSTKSPQKQQTPGSQTNNSNDTARPPSPAKSSLSRASRFGVKGGFDPENEIWSDADGHRHAKSVTFDAAPPQVNEYEMTTPDPSSAASDSRDGSYDSEEDEEEDEGDISFERASSADHEDSFDASLEDTEKTPVVLPEEWRYSNEDEDEASTEDEEDANHSPDPRPTSRQEPSRPHSRVGSFDSNGEPRPLPPLPSVMRSQTAQSSPGKFTTAALELGSGGQRTLPSPPGPATYSKSDITGFKNSSMSLEDRLRLIMIQDGKKDEKQPDNQEPDQKPAKADNGHHEDINDEVKKEDTETKKDGEDAAEEAAEPDVFTPPRISRDSILRDLRKGDDFYDEEDEDSYMDYDPDVPLPSLEHDDDDDYDTDSVIIKEEAEDDSSGLYDIPDYYENVPSKDSSLKDIQGKLPHDESSHYSLHSAGAGNAHSPGAEEPEDRSSTPVPASAEETEKTEHTGHIEKAPEKESPDDAHKEPEQARPVSALDVRPASALDLRPDSALDMSAIRETLQRPGTPEQDEEPVSEPATPDSVIHHPVEDDDDESDVSADESVPYPIATVKAPGTGLKVRPSLTPADLEQMAATRRKVSGPQPPPRLPSLSKHFSNDSQHSTHDNEGHEEHEEHEPEVDSDKLAPPFPNKDATQRQSSLVKLDIPFSIQEESLGFGLDKEFDRVMENQKVAFEQALSKCSSFRPMPVTQTQDPFISPQGPKDPAGLSHIHIEASGANPPTPKQRGYLMRQNTKVIVASSHNDEETATTPGEAATEARLSRTPGNSNRKPSQQTWTTVPWNSQRRRSSIRTPSGIPKKKSVPGAVPPLPGQASNVQETAAAAEEAEPGLNEALDEGEERGRLFVKVVGIKYLDLPMPRGRFP